MAWAGGVWDSSNGTSTGSIGIAAQIYYDKKFLSRVQDSLVMNQFGQKRPLPKNSGRYIEFYRYHEIDNITSPLTEGTNPDPTAITGHSVKREIEEWGGFSQVSSLLDMTKIDRGIANMAGVWGDNAGRSMDLRIMKEVVANGCHQIRCDGTASGPGQAPGCYSGSVSSTAATTTVIYSEGAFNGSNDLDQTDDFWIGGTITFTSGKNYGQSRVITDSDGTAFTVSVTLPFENAAAVGDEFIISHPCVSGTTPAADDLDTTDFLTHKSFQKALIELREQKAMPFGGGYYVMIVDPSSHANFMSDSTWTPLHEYRPSLGESGLIRGEVGKYMGFRVVETTQPFRAPMPDHTSGAVASGEGPGQTDTNYYTAGANYSASEDGHYNLALGREAYGVTMLSGFNKPKIIVKRSGSQDTSNPLNRYMTIGWQLDFVPCALNGLWAVAVVSGG